MKKIFTLLPACMLLAVVTAKAQVFWAETFDGIASTGLDVTSYSDALGTWTLTVTSPEDGSPNHFYVSCKEAGHLAGVCGSTCSSSTDTGPTLHIGSSSLGDIGAAYDAGEATSRRAESPTIDCSGKTNITLSFYYIENGDGTNDDAILYYSADNGATWTFLDNPAKTPVCPSTQGRWQRYSFMLPAACNNNAHVKLGFLWVNDNDGFGTDPSFAVDSIALSTVASTTVPTASFTTSSTTLCQDSCITITSTTTGGTDSIRWTAPGATVASGTTTPTTVCFPNPGTFTVHLYAYGGGGVDSASATITVNPAPHPIVSQTGNTLTVTSSYSSYQWVKNDTAISGATSGSYTYTVSGTYQVIVDSGGCAGASAAIAYTLGVAEVSNEGAHFSVAQSGNDGFALHSTTMLSANLYIQVFDETGRKIYGDVWQSGTDKKQCIMNDLSHGLYIIRLGNSSTSAVLKWMKE